ncbi:retrovirus-related pol polyprotein from transposon TNT 1-94 [Tanacetum coccineum]|uniref:Retrovirus-related pol polyprotein from transposon TNT 1-94 n=1 Tax=Tanacetum coccineum TaxID=301880 RepID=A0ABQ5IE28_9ASTR
MLEDLKYVKVGEKEVDDLKMETEFFSKDFLFVILVSLDDIDEYSEMSCKYLEKIKERERLENEFPRVINKKNDTSFAQLEKHCINLEIALQNEKEKNFVNDVNARTKKPHVVPISTRKPIRKANQYVATPHKKTVASESTNLEVAFKKSTCFVRDIQGNDLLTSTRGSDLYTIALQESSSPIPIFFMAKASPAQAWLCHHRLSHPNFDIINLLSKNDIVNGLPKLKYVKDQLCSSCDMGKAKRRKFKTKSVPSSKGRLHMLHMDLCGPMRVKSINRKKFILLIVDDYSRYTWNHFLRSKDEIPENSIVKRQNHTLVEAAGTMLSASKLPFFFWAEAIETACYTQNRSLIIPRHKKTPYHIINERKPTLKFLHIFCCTSYIVRDGENLDKIKEKRDPCIFLGYATQSKGYSVYNKRTRLIVEYFHINFDELKEVMMPNHNSSSLATQQQMKFDHNCSNLISQRQMALDYDNSSPAPQLQPTSVHNNTKLKTQDQNNKPSSSKLIPNIDPSADKTDPSLQELDLLLSPMCEEYFSGGNQGVSKSSTISDLQQQYTSPTLNVQHILEPSTLTTNVNVEDNNSNQAVNAQFDIDEFINPFRTSRKQWHHAWIKSMQEELQKPGHLAARLGCAETKVATWDDLAFKHITFWVERDA